MLVACLGFEVGLGLAFQVPITHPLIAHAFCVVRAFLRASSVAHATLIFFSLICEILLGKLESFWANIGQRGWCLVPDAAVPILALGASFGFEAPLCLTRFFT